MMRVSVAFWTVLLSIVVSATAALAQQEPATPGSAGQAPAPASTAGAPTAAAGATTGRSSAAASGSAAPAGSDVGASSPAPVAASAAPGGASATTGSAAPVASPAAPATTAAAPATAPRASAAAAAGRPLDGATFAVRLRDLEQRIDELKEQIRRSHTRLSLLSDTILSGGVGGARSEIEFRNEMSDAFRLTKLLVVLDGAVLYNKADESGALAEQAKVPIFSGSIPPGDHTVQVKVELRGHGYGVFSYLRGYSFKVENSHSFTVTEGKTVQLNLIAYEKGGITTPLEQRPNVRFVETVTAGVKGARGKAGAASKAGTSASIRAGGQ
ncbi:MAG: hypothetical protein JW940_05620 [Polyangiaceae bacterium]|nr:hypothetical protein [Polyangiaceae bacterium]